VAAYDGVAAASKAGWHIAVFETGSSQSRLFGGLALGQCGSWGAGSFW
jgi:hypothetical protein